MGNKSLSSVQVHANFISHAEQKNGLDMVNALIWVGLIIVAPLLVGSAIGSVGGGQEVVGKAILGGGMSLFYLWMATEHDAKLPAAFGFLVLVGSCISHATP